jgi:hypothetical protein
MSLSKEFQMKVDSILHASAAHKGVDATPRTKELLGPADNTTYADWDFLSTNRAKITEKWNDVFG